MNFENSHAEYSSRAYSSSQGCTLQGIYRIESCCCLARNAPAAGDSVDDTQFDLDEAVNC